jgi:hypothetical protein
MRLQRSKKFLVGKTIGPHTWLHKLYEGVLPQKVLAAAKRKLPKAHKYDILKFNKTTEAISFIRSVDFNYSMEPLVGTSIKVTTDGLVKKTAASTKNPLIYHHKWLMVKDGYPGFDIQESIDRSKIWKKAIGSDRSVTSRIGRRNYWLTEVVPKIITEELGRSGKTAMARKDISRPTKVLLSRGCILGSVLHHGCGKAVQDSAEMRKVATVYSEFDPKFAPDRNVLSRKYTTIVSNYVMNTLPREARLSAWQDLSNCTSGSSFVTIRQDKLRGQPFKDGFLTSKGTYQELLPEEKIKDEAREFFNQVTTLYKNSSLLILRCSLPRR